MKTLFKIGKIFGIIAFASGGISELLGIWFNQATWFPFIKQIGWFGLVGGFVLAFLCGIMMLVLLIISKIRK